MGEEKKAKAPADGAAKREQWESKVADGVRAVFEERIKGGKARQEFLRAELDPGKFSSEASDLFRKSFEFSHVPAAKIKRKVRRPIYVKADRGGYVVASLRSDPSSAPLYEALARMKPGKGGRFADEGLKRAFKYDMMAASGEDPAGEIEKDMPWMAEETARGRFEGLLKSAEKGVSADDVMQFLSLEEARMSREVDEEGKLPDGAEEEAADFLELFAESGLEAATREIRLASWKEDAALVRVGGAAKRRMMEEELKKAAGRLDGPANKEARKKAKQLRKAILSDTREMQVSVLAGDWSGRFGVEDMKSADIGREEEVGRFVLEQLSPAFVGSGGVVTVLRKTGEDESSLSGFLVRDGEWRPVPKERLEMAHRLMPDGGFAKKPENLEYADLDS